MLEDRINTLIALTISHPHSFKMSRWLQLEANEPCETVEEIMAEKERAIACLGESREDCGTVGCIAGWSVVLFEPTDAEIAATKANPLAFISYSIFGVGMARLGLTEDQAYAVFYENDWPMAFKDKMRDKYGNESHSRFIMQSSAIRVRERLQYLLETKT